MCLICLSSLQHTKSLVLHTSFSCSSVFHHIHRTLSEPCLFVFLPMRGWAKWSKSSPPPSWWKISTRKGSELNCNISGLHAAHVAHWSVDFPHEPSFHFFQYSNLSLLVSLTPAKINQATHQRKTRFYQSELDSQTHLIQCEMDLVVFSTRGAEGLSSDWVWLGSHFFFLITFPVRKDPENLLSLCSPLWFIGARHAHGTGFFFTDNIIN